MPEGKVTTVKNAEEATWEEVHRITALYNKHFGLGYRLKFADPKFRAGQADTTLSDIHLFAKIKKGKVNDEFILEINYIALLAHSGAYKILGTQEAGVHEGDWEHLTVRCTTEGKLLAVYYSAHRHGDGTWVSAKSCPFDEATGRLLAFVALNGHGFYPGTGTHAHVFFFANNLTSSRGRVWGSKECHIFEYPGKWLTKGKVELKKLPEAEDRGTKYVEAYEDSELEYYHKPLQPGQDNPAAVHDIKVSVPGTDWLRWKLRWGTVAPCWNSTWYKNAEHPTGSYALKRTWAPWLR